MSSTCSYLNRCSVLSKWWLLRRKTEHLHKYGNPYADSVCTYSSELGYTIVELGSPTTTQASPPTVISISFDGTASKLVPWKNIFSAHDSCMIRVDTYFLLCSHAILTVIRIAVFNSRVYSFVSSALPSSANEGSGLTPMLPLTPAAALSTEIEYVMSSEPTVSWAICGVRHWMNVAVTFGQIDSWGWQMDCCEWQYTLYNSDLSAYWSVSITIGDSQHSSLYHIQVTPGEGQLKATTREIEVKYRDYHKAKDLLS